MNRMQKERIIHSLVVAMMCATTPWVDAIITDIRLVDGPSPNEGRLEVSDPIRGWGTVCSTGWDILDTVVVCRELGYPGANSFLSSDSPFGQSTASILISHVECNGTENSLINCTYNEMITRCTHQKDVGIICHKPGYIGCFGDSFDSVFKDSDARYTDTTGMTIDSCISYCQDQDLQYAGLEYTSECYCVGSGTQYDALGTFGDSECQYICSGNMQERCGGLGRISVFDTTVGFCEDPGEPNYGSRQGNWFRYGASVTFDCAEGYNLTGNQSIQCLGVDGSPTVDWNADTPMCLGPTVIPTTTGPSTAGPTTQNTFTTGFFTTKITAASTAAETPTPYTTDGTTTAVTTTSTDPMTSFSITTEDLEMTTTLNVDSTTEAITTNVAPTTRSLEMTGATGTLVTSRTDSITTSTLTTVDVTMVTTSNSENSFTSSIDTLSSTEPLSTSDMSSTNIGMTSPADKTELPPSTTSDPEDITGTHGIHTEVTTSDTTDITGMATSTEEVDTTEPPLGSTQATPTTPSTTSNATPRAESQGGGWPWPPLGIGLLLGGIILGLLLFVLVICLLVISPRAKAKKEEEEAVRLRNARQAPGGNSYSPDIILDRNGRRSYRRNEIQRVEDSEAHDNGAFLPDDASIIGVYGERQRAVENPYATFPSDDDTSKKILFADTARKLNHIYVPGSPNGSTYSRGTQRSSSDRFGAQLVV